MDEPSGTDDHVVLRGSLRPFLAAGASALGLGTLAVPALIDEGSAPWPVAVLLVALLALGVLLLDLPLRIEFGVDGVDRVCLLRRGRIPWARVVAIERQRRRLTGPGTGGLIVLGRRGRWLLTTSAEPPHVHARLARVVAMHAPSVRMLAEAPAVTTDRG